MKKIFLSAIAVLSMVAVACTPEETQESLEVTSSEMTVEVSGTESPISFTTTSAWTIECDEDWVSFDKTEGEAGDVTVVMTVEANTEYESRTATVTISMGGKKSAIEITQAGIAEFAIETVYDIDYTAQTIEFTITSNIEYTCEISEDAAGWISSVDSKAAPVESSLLFNVSENDGLDSRTGKIYVTAGENIYCLTVNQAPNFEVMTSATAIYLGNTMKIYDFNTYAYTTFDEYYIELSSEEGVTVGLAINTAKPEDPLAGIPAGTYAIDATGTHAENTFSIKPLDGSEKLYTTVIRNGAESEILDGEISVETDGTSYTIIAMLQEDTGISSFSFQGAIDEIADNSFGAMQYSCSWKNTYDTYFASKNNIWSISLCVNKAPDADTPYVQFMTFSLVGEAGDITGEELPVGTFTLAEPETLTNTGYSSGTLNAQTGTFYDFTANDADQNKCELLDGATITVEKNDDGTYDFTLKGSFRHYSVEYDENYNEIITELGEFDYNATYSNIAVSIDVTTASKPTPDEDHEFTSMGFNPSYSGMYYGNNYDVENTHTFVINLPYVDNTYTVNLCLNIEGEWTFEANVAGRYCNTPLPEAVCTYAATSDVTANSLVGNTSSYITNGYTGTKMYICGGSVKITDSEITFDVQAKANTENAQVYNFTGTVATTLYYIRDVR